MSTLYTKTVIIDPSGGLGSAIFDLDVASAALVVILDVQILKDEANLVTFGNGDTPCTNNLLQR